MIDARGNTCLTAIFVDYDNIYLSLRRKNEEAARRFSNNAESWVKAIISGKLMVSSGSPAGEADGIERRLVVNRCYGNPVPRRNANDNATDSHCFPFVRKHFVHMGAEVIDCPPLTQQLKNSSDIRMVMDMRDMLNHETRLDEFIILSGDADFTPVLTRLRAHARRTVIFANDQTAPAYSALADAHINESDLITLLMSGETGALSVADNASIGEQIIAIVMKTVDGSNEPVPIETLADRAQRALGHEKTVGSSWAGYGGFLALLKDGLPDRASLLSAGNSYTVGDRARVGDQGAAADRDEGATSSVPAVEQQVAPAIEERAPSEVMADARAAEPAQPAPAQSAPVTPTEPVAPAAVATPPRLEPSQPKPAGEVQSFGAAAAPSAPAQQPAAPVTQQAVAQPVTAATPEPVAPAAPAQPAPPPQPAAPSISVQAARTVQEAITRIPEASQAPVLAPTDYQIVFAVISQELQENGINGTQTVANAVARAGAAGLNVQPDDVRFILNVVGEADPWFQQGNSPALFAARFQNYVIARCRAAGLQLSVEELELIQTWFTAGTAAASEQSADAQWQQQEKAEAARGQQGEGLPQFLQRG